MKNSDIFTPYFLLPFSQNGNNIACRQRKGNLPDTLPQHHPFDGIGLKDIMA
jgi:hypothetical protein